MYATDNRHYLSHDERYRARLEADTALAILEGQRRRRERASTYLAGGLAALRRQPRPEFREAAPAAERQGKALLGRAGIEYRR